MTKFKKKIQNCGECGEPLPDKMVKFGKKKVYQCINPECRAINTVFYKVLVYIRDPYGDDTDQPHQFLSRAKRDRFLKECDKDKIKYKIISKKPIL